MVSKFYADNWEQTNEWLIKNAPEYVIKCIEELSNALRNANDHALETELALRVVEKKSAGSGIAINEIRQLVNDLKALQDEKDGILNQQ